MTHSRFEQAAGAAAGALAGLSARRAIATLLLALALAVAAVGYFITHIQIDTDTVDMLDENLPFRQAIIERRALFPSEGSEVAVVVDGPDGATIRAGAAAMAAKMRARDDLFLRVARAEETPYFRENGLLFLDEDRLEETLLGLEQAAPLIGALADNTSLRGLAGAMGLVLGEAADGGDLGGLDGPLDRIAAAVEREAAGEPGLLDWRGLFRPEPAEPEIFQAWIDQRFSTLGAGGAGVKAARAMAAEVMAETPGAEILITGRAALKYDELQSVQDGMGRIGLISLVAVALILVLGLGSVRLALAALATLLVGLAATAGLAAVTIGSLNLISVAFAVLFIGLGADAAIHYALRWRAETGDNRAAMAARGVGPALALCMLTSAAAFLGFWPTDYRGLAELGLISAMGMGMALLTTLTVLPALLRLFGGAGGPPRPWRLDGGFVARRPRSVLAIWALAALIAAPFALEARFDADPMALRAADAESVRGWDRIAESSAAHPYRANLILPDIATAQAEATRLAAIDGVRWVRGPWSYVPEDQEEKLLLVGDFGPLMQAALFFRPPPPGDLTAEGRAEAVGILLERARAAASGAQDPAIRAAAARLATALEGFDGADGATLAGLARRLTADLRPQLETLAAGFEARPVGIDDIPDFLRETHLSPSGAVLIQIAAQDDLSDPDALEAFARLVTEAAPRASGEPIILTAAENAVLSAFATATAIAIIAALLFLIVAHRRPGDVAASLAPLFLAAIVVAGLTTAIGQPFNFANVIVLPLLFGLGVDFGAHLTARAREGRIGPDVTSRAVIVSGLTTFASFGALALSPHRGTASMGLLLLIAVALAMVAALTVQPAIRRLAAGDANE